MSDDSQAYGGLNAPRPSATERKAYDVAAGDGHPMANDEQLVTWLNALPSVEARNTVAIRVDEHQTIIKQFKRDPEDGKILLERVPTVEDPQVYTTQPIEDEPQTVDTPDWLWEKVVMWDAKMGGDADGE